jgi:hypothetical protein
MALKVEPGTFPIPKIPTKFQDLSQTADSLNSASDRLNRVIEKLETALKSLNLGISARVKFDSWSDEDGNCGYDEIGYNKLGDKWTLALKTVSGILGDEGCDSTEWSFNNAPRELRIRAVAHIPELIEELNKIASKVVQDLEEKTKEADELANALSAAVSTPRYSLKISQLGGQK